MKKFLIFIASVVILVACNKGPSVSDVENELKKSISIGSDKEQVIAYLNAHGYKNSANYKPEIYYDKQKIIDASTNKTYGNIFAGRKIYIHFQFDKNDKLISFKVYDAITAM